MFRLLAIGFFTVIVAVASALAAADADSVGLSASEEIVLHNGVRLVVIPTASSVVAAAWSVGVGSAAEPLGLTGATHLLEHLLFKGTTIVGTVDLRRELEIESRQDELETELGRRLRRHWASSTRTGLDPRDRATWPDRLRTLGEELEALDEERRSVTRLGEFSLRYSEAGAVGLDAATFEDLTLSWVTLPAESLELWFWLESDRLLGPMLRELRSEKRVVEQERRTELARPEARFDLGLRGVFWDGDPYGRSVLGREMDVATISRVELQDWFESRFRPDELVLVIVGGCDPETVERMARRYFGRFVGTESTLPSVPSPLPPRSARLHETADVRSRLRIMVRTIPFGHPDAPALEVLVGLLSGRSGRFYRELVVGRDDVFAAYTQHRRLRRGGELTIDLEGQSAVTAIELERIWRDWLSRFLRSELDPAELVRVQNQVAADAYRRVREPAALARQVAVLEQLGSWRELESWADAVARVTVDDVRRVTATYFASDRLTIGLLDRDGIPESRP